MLETPHGVGNSKGRRCPKCGRRMVRHINGEYYCPNCGYVEGSTITPWDAGLRPFHPRIDGILTGAPLRPRTGAAVIDYVVRKLDLGEAVRRRALECYRRLHPRRRKARTWQVACVLKAAREMGIPLRVKRVSKLIGVRPGAINDKLKALNANGIEVEDVLRRISKKLLVPYEKLLSTYHDFRNLHFIQSKDPAVIAATVAVLAGCKIEDAARAAEVAPSSIKYTLRKLGYSMN